MPSRRALRSDATHAARRGPRLTAMQQYTGRTEEAALPPIDEFVSDIFIHSKVGKWRIREFDDDLRFLDQIGASLAIN